MVRSMHPIYKYPLHVQPSNKMEKHSPYKAKGHLMIKPKIEGIVNAASEFILYNPIELQVISRGG